MRRQAAEASDDLSSPCSSCLRGKVHTCTCQACGHTLAVGLVKKWGWSCLLAQSGACACLLQVLFQGGGMLRDLDAALDTIAQRLQTHGWVACELGAHRKLMERAVQESRAWRQNHGLAVAFCFNVAIIGFW